MLSDHHKNDFLPRHLSQAEIRNPFQVLHSFFDYSHLPDIRISFEEWVETTVTGDYSKGLNRTDRKNLMHFISHVRRVIEASHVLYERKYGPAIGQQHIFKSLSNSVIKNETLLEKPGLYVAAESVLQITQAEKIFFVREDGCEKNVRYHFIVFIPDSNRLSHESILRQIDSDDNDDCKLIVKLVNTRRGYEQLLKGHLFFLLNCRPDKTIFDDGKLPLPDPDLLSINQVYQNAKNAFERERGKAKAFFEGAHFLSDRGQNSISCFMLHQSLELVLRGVIIAFCGRDMQTHDLLYLFSESEQCLEMSPIKNLFEEGLLDTLQRCYIGSRYSGDFYVSDWQIQKLTTTIESIFILIETTFYKILEMQAKHSENINETSPPPLKYSPAFPHL